MREETHVESGYQALAQELERGGIVWRVTSLEEDTLGEAVQSTHAPAWLGHGLQPPCQTLDDRGRAVLVECLRREKTLLICGGGHVSVPVAQLGVMLGYDVMVVDDREKFADPARFVPGVHTVCAPFGPYLSREFDWNGYQDLSVVIVTRGHGADAVCLREAVKHPLTYLGMIGSKRKNEAIFQLLMGEGVTPEALERVHAPIGLSIGAQTPEEIAVSIAAEWIATRSSGRGSILPQDLREVLLSGAKGVMVTVVRKTGSAPRDVGARMFLGADGSTVGTIGGGLAEYQATCAGRAMMEAPRTMLKSYEMRSGEAGRSGMICGGDIDVLFEVV